MGSIKKEVDLSDLPRNEKTGNIDWKNSVGCKCHFIYGDIVGEIKIVDYKRDKNQPYIMAVYKDRQKWITVPSFKKGSIGNLLGVYTSDFRYQIGNIIQTKQFDIKILNRKYIKMDDRNRKIYTCKCMHCGYQYDTQEIIIKNSGGCPACAGIDLVKGINDIPTTAPWMIPYFQGGKDEASQYQKGSTQYIYPVCPICGKKSSKKIQISKIYANHSIGCQCDTSMSFPEQMMYNILNQFNVEFIHQATKKVLKWADNYRYDFFVRNLNLIIEMNGDQHINKPIYYKKNVKDEMINDQQKEMLARNNGIMNYYQIDCQKSNVDYILESLKKSGVLDLLQININQIDKNQLYESIFKKDIDICKAYINRYPLINHKELSNITKIPEYRIQKVLQHLNIKLPSLSGQRVCIYKNGELLHMFGSFDELKRNSDEVLGFHINIASVGNYIKDNKIYKKFYTFGYYNPEYEVIKC